MDIKVDIEEFAKQEAPTGKRSKLVPYREQIFALKNAGYAQIQIRRWLKLNNFIISVEGLRDFIKKQEKLILANPSLITMDGLDKKLPTPSIKVLEPPPIKQPDVAPTKPSTGGTFKEKADRVSGKFFEDPNLAAIGQFNKPKDNT